MIGVWSVKGGGLPQEGGELAGTRDRDDAGGLAPLAVQVLPARVETSLGAPCDLDHARIRSGLSAGGAACASKESASRRGRPRRGEPAFCP